MKKLLLLFALLSSFFTFAQVPQGISYQAIALNGSGVAVVNSTVGIRLSILDDSATGTVLYTETHLSSTNAQGLFHLVIGQGTPTLGTFSSIKWETNSKFLKVEMDETGGSIYVLVGTTQLLSVPYAMYAGKVNKEDIVGGGDISFVSSTVLNTNSFITDTNAYIYAASSVSPYQYSWHSTPILGTPLMKSLDSFLTTTNAYIFGNDQWYSYPISGSPQKIVATGGSILVVTSTNAYSFQWNGTNPIWTPTAISGTVVEATSNWFTVAVLTSTNFYISNPSTNSSWISTPITGTPLKIKHTYGGIMALTSTNAYIYGPDSFDPNDSSSAIYGWHSLPISVSLKFD
jgi:hypothetical protein